MPPGHDSLEARAREAVQRRLSRGSVTANLELARASSVPVIRLNEAALSQVLTAAERVRALAGSPPVTVEALLGIRGVLETVEPTETPEAEADRLAAMYVTFERALEALVDSRAREGGRLTSIVQGQLDEISRLVDVVVASPARRPEAIARRLAEQVTRLTAGSSPLDPDRLHQEAVMLATKADVEEEVQRLRVHLASARDLLASDAPAGRQLDFLTQEFNREANTLCAKANDPEISRAGLAMKVVIDQMREQVANIE
jgi:uncharacterized protein (TIGR00255 family)